MRQDVCNTPVAVAHEQQIEVEHPVVVSLMEEIVSGDSCPCVCETTEKSQQIAFISHSKRR